MGRVKRKRRDLLAQQLLPIALAVPVVTAHDRFGFGAKKRAPEFAEAILKQLKDIEEGKADLADIMDRFEQLTGLRIE